MVITAGDVKNPESLTVNGLWDIFTPGCEHFVKESPMARPSWDEYFMEITHLVARRSTCLRRQVGAVLVKDKNILATGYNGSPSGVAHCLDVGCLRAQLGVPSGERHELCRGLHAEQNAIIQAAKHGTNIDGATLYCTTMPCIICSKMIINAGIRRIVYEEGYADQLASEMITETAIVVDHFPTKSPSGAEP
jgi:dCMP deaminase